MSHAYYKIEIDFDSNAGWTEHQTLYGIEDNCIDCFWLRHADGDEVVCNGTDSYTVCLAHALMLKDYDKMGDRVKVTKIPFSEMPEAVRREFDGSIRRVLPTQQLNI